MKKVLEVAYPALNNSGVPAVIMGIVRELHNEFKFDILVFRTEVGYHEKEFKSYGGDVHIINCDKKKNRIINIMEKISRPFRLYFGTKKILKQNHYDAIHCHNGFDSGWCILAAKRCNVPIRVVHSHASKNPFEKEPKSTKLYKKLMRKIINKNTTTRIGCSQIAADNLYGENIDTTIVLNAAKLSKFDSSISNVSINNNAPKIVFVGRITIQKNPIFLLEIFEEIKKKIPSASLMIIGFGDMEEAVKEKIMKDNIQNVKILPHSTDITNILAQSDIFILPSFYEGLPVVLVEAQTMGLHCFVSDTIANESDLGLCSFLSLADGKDKWGSEIVDYIKSNQNKEFPNKQTLSNYNWEIISKQYRHIYNAGCE